MKCLTIVIIALVAFVAADEVWKPPPYNTLDQLLKQCDKELSPEQKVAMDKGEDVFENVLCRVKKLGIFSDENGFSIDRLMALFTSYNFDAEKSRDGITKCIETNQKTGTVAEWAFRTDSCIRKVKLVDVKKNN